MCKPKCSFAGAAMLVAALMCAAARAAGPVLPPNSIGPDAIAVIHVDGAHFNPELLKEAAKAILGANAETANDAIAKFTEKYDKAVKSGIDGITMVIGDAAFVGPDAGLEKPPSIAVYVQLGPAADVTAAAELMTSDMDRPDREKVVYEQKGAFLVMHEKEVPLPTTFDAARTGAFAEALGTVSGASLQIAIIITPGVKQEMARQEVPLKALKEAQLAFSDSKWSTVAITLGNTPAVTVTVHAADANSAKQLSDGIKAGLDNLKQQTLANPKPGDPFGAMFAQLVDALRPTTNGNIVNVTLKGESLTTIVSMVTVNLKSIFGQSEQVRAKMDMANLEVAIELYHFQCGEYPKNLDALVHDPGAAGWHGPYLKNGMPDDPWRHSYHYVFPGKHNADSFDLWSDGNGKKPPEDLDNWTGRGPKN